MTSTGLQMPSCPTRRSRGNGVTTGLKCSRAVGLSSIGMVH
jgi:hypothetical protein